MVNSFCELTPPPSSLSQWTTTKSSWWSFGRMKGPPTKSCQKKLFIYPCHLFVYCHDESVTWGWQPAGLTSTLSLYIYSWCCCLPYLLPLTKNPINKFSSYIFCMGETIFGSYNWFGSRQKKEQADDGGDHVTYPQGVVNKGGGGMKLFLKNILGFLSLFFVEFL